MFLLWAAAELCDSMWLTHSTLSLIQNTLAHRNHCTNTLTHVLSLLLKSLIGVIMYTGVTYIFFSFSYWDLSGFITAEPWLESSSAHLYEIWNTHTSTLFLVVNEMLSYYFIKYISGLFQPAVFSILWLCGLCWLWTRHLHGRDPEKRGLQNSVYQVKLSEPPTAFQINTIFTRIISNTYFRVWQKHRKQPPETSIIIPAWPLFVIIFQIDTFQKRTFSALMPLSSEQYHLSVSPKITVTKMIQWFKRELNPRPKLSIYQSIYTTLTPALTYYMAMS